MLALLAPLSNAAAGELARAGVTLETALSRESIVSMAVERVEVALSGGQPALPCGDLDCVAAARLALYIAAATGERRLVERLATAESRALLAALRRADYDVKLALARDLGIDAAWLPDLCKSGAVQKCEVLAQYFTTGVRWTSYLKFAPEAPEWAMINRVVVRGWVLLSTPDLERLVAEAYRLRALELAGDELRAGLVARRLRDVEEQLRERFARIVQPIRLEMPEGSPDPPCMAAIMDALRRGENLPHTARFALAAYLLRRGWDVERVVDLFRSAPDFNERITRYQVMHIAGQAGGRKQYMVPNCQTMLSWGLCPNNLACGVKNPLLYRAGRRRLKSSAPSTAMAVPAAAGAAHAGMPGAPPAWRLPAAPGGEGRIGEGRTGGGGAGGGAPAGSS
jgi:DNA primase large subunit